MKFKLTLKIFFMSLITTTFISCNSDVKDVNEKNGFLPIKEPMRYLPELYKSLQILIDDLPILKDEKIKEST